MSSIIKKYSFIGRPKKIYVGMFSFQVTEQHQSFDDHVLVLQCAEKGISLESEYKKYLKNDIFYVRRDKMDYFYLVFIDEDKEVYEVKYEDLEKTVMTTNQLPLTAIYDLWFGGMKPYAIVSVLVL